MELIWIIALINGVVVGAAAIFLFVRSRAFLRRSIRTDALVVDSLARQSKHRDAQNNSTTATTYRPVVEFTDEGGEHRRAEISLGMSHPSWNVGDTISVRYVPEEPTSVKLDTLIGLWFPCLACAFISVWTIIGSLLIRFFVLAE